MEIVTGFSKLSKFQKVKWINDYFSHSIDSNLKQFWLDDPKLQKTIDEFSENTISNFLIPYGIAPNFLINDKVFAIPMVIEESSVVAAAAKSAKFWSLRGGFKTQIVSKLKAGQVHFFWEGEFSKLHLFFTEIKDELLEHLQPLTLNMENRGGGISHVELLNLTEKLPCYHQLSFKFDTCDAMGANFINSILETAGLYFSKKAKEAGLGDVEINMAILSNYTPECLVTASVNCSISHLGGINGMPSEVFSKKFKQAIDIACVDRSRAVTHNKGIFNGIDALILATGNDFRAIEACGHAYAARDGNYRSLSSANITENEFELSLTLPISVGTIGGLTQLHPLAKTSFDIMGRPDASKLMQIAACVGLASNFGAVSSLVTTGIQKGHMKMHLLNICKQYEASEEETQKVKDFFSDKVVSVSAVREYLKELRNWN